MLSDNSVAIIDYGMGNLRSVEKAFVKIGANVTVANTYRMIEKAAKIVLPGVGAFNEGMSNLKKLDLISPLNEAVFERKSPFLGICLGMQLLGEKSYEITETPGLGWIWGEVVKFDAESIKVPHVGWNSISFTKQNPLFQNIPDQTDFYFAHSYHFGPETVHGTSLTRYGVDFASSVNKDNIFGVQFHPEKSQRYGLEILLNFVNL